MYTVLGEFHANRWRQFYAAAKRSDVSEWRKLHKWPANIFGIIKEFNKQCNIEAAKKEKEFMKKEPDKRNLLKQHASATGWKERFFSANTLFSHLRDVWMLKLLNRSLDQMLHAASSLLAYIFRRGFTAARWRTSLLKSPTTSRTLVHILLC